MAQRADLARVQERQTQKAGGEEQTEQENESSRHCNGRRIALVTRRSCHDGHAGAHAESRDDHQLAAAEAVDCQDPDGGADGLEGEDACAEDSCQYAA